MTLDPRDLYAAEGSIDRAPLRRSFKDCDIWDRPIYVDAAAPLLLENLPMGYNNATGFWEPWDVDGAPGEADEIGAFLYRDTQLSATGEVVGELIVEGTFDVRDIDTAALRAQLQNSPTSNELRDALADRQLRALGLHIQGVLQP
jgi:hypothetical protein